MAKQAPPAAAQRQYDASESIALSDHGTNFAWGVGAQARFGRIGARLEYERFDVTYGRGEGSHPGRDYTSKARLRAHAPGEVRAVIGERK